MYELNIEACSCNHCYSGKSISIAYSECVYVALVIQHAMRIRHIFICGLPRSTTFFRIVSLKARFSKKKVSEHKTCFDFPYKFFLKQFSF